MGRTDGRSREDTEGPGGTDCKLKIEKLKFVGMKLRRRENPEFECGSEPVFDLQFAICNLQFAIS